MEDEVIRVVVEQADKAGFPDYALTIFVTVLSGVLARQAQEVIDVYRQHDPKVELSVWNEEEGWVCIAGSRAA